MEDQFKIGKRTFISAFMILLCLLIGAGILTKVLPMGSYEYVMIDGRETVVQDSFRFIEGDTLPVYKWFLAPFESLVTDDGVIIIAIILFLLIIGGTLSILNQANILNTIINSIVLKYKDRPYTLVRMLVFIFMCLGAFVGIFEEVIPLVPLIVSLSIAMGFDVMTGLGMSLLASGFGFSAAVSNPFTIGIAQKIADIPVFSGAFYRIIIFAITYVFLSTMLVSYAKSIQGEMKEFDEVEGGQVTKAVRWFLGMMGFMIIIILLSPFIAVLSAYNLPIIGLIFLITGIGSGIFSGFSFKKIAKTFFSGASSMLPGVVLILLATGVKHVIQSGQIMDTILYYAAEAVLDSSNFTALLLVYGLVLILNFFIGSGSAKAFIVMPIIIPILEMMGVSRQIAVLAFQFGDGFSNLLYPTNAVLLIGIGLADVSYVKWFRWVLKYQLMMLLLSIGFLGIGLLIGY